MLRTIQENYVRALRDEIHQMESELAKAKADLAHAEARLAEEPSEAAANGPVSPGEFHKMRVSDAICAYLNKTAKPCLLEPDLREVLARGGAALGKVPKRSVKLGVVANPDRLYLDEKSGMVYLAEWRRPALVATSATG